MEGFFLALGEDFKEGEGEDIIVVAAETIFKLFHADLLLRILEQSRSVFEMLIKINPFRTNLRHLIINLLLQLPLLQFFSDLLIHFQIRSIASGPIAPSTVPTGSLTSFNHLIFQSLIEFPLCCIHAHFVFELTL